MRKGEEFKAPRYASAAATRDYITICNIIPTVTISATSIISIIFVVSKTFVIPASSTC